MVQMEKALHLSHKTLPMNSEIPAVYTDNYGTIHTIIKNDSETLTIELDGIAFTGSTFISFKPENAPTLPDRFALDQYGQLTNYGLSFRILLSTWKGVTQIPGVLLADVEYKEDLNDPFYCPWFHFSFELENEIIEIGKLQQFEGVFERLRGKLPADIVIKTCYTCLYSDYGVAGSDIFGSMLCFRNVKETYLKVTSKDNYMDMMDNFDRFVQETYLCEDFVIRSGDVGYRG